VIANTVKGKGVSFMENDVAWHGVAPKPEQVDAAVKELEEAAKQIR
jgi:transketolase